MRSNIMTGVFAMVFLFVACGEGEGGCKALSWESSSSADSINIDLKSGAGNQCSNYSDYYDADLNQIIAKIQSMKFVLNRKCYELTSVDSDPEEIEVACPEFVPETIEFGEIVKCSFGTPPAENTSCLADPLKMAFKSEAFFEEIEWTFWTVESPEFGVGSNEIGKKAFGASKDGINISGYFKDDNLNIAGIVFKWNEDEVEKTLEFGATVETKQ